VIVEAGAADPRRPAVLLASPMSGSLVRQIGERYDVVGPLSAGVAEVGAQLSDAERARVGAIVALGVERIDAAVLAQLPNVVMVCCLGSGYDGIDLAAARGRGIAVAHSPGANAASVADVALALTIECVRDIPRLREHLRNGRWNGLDGARPEGRRGLTGLKFGIYGLGAIGEKIARRAQACEMSVGYHGRRPHDGVAYPYFATLHALAEWSDVLCLSARLDAGNRRIVDRRVLNALGREGFLVNIARGALVDEAALIEALQAGTIAGAGLDVFEHEPEVPEALLSLSNVALTPHIGGVTTESRANMEAMVLANLAACFAGAGAATPIPSP
jgi:lactate dehydrogenase-like 2-hydroxyacid dehydrogenase